MELMGAAGPWEKLVLPGVFSQNEALRTVVERPVLFMRMEIVAGAAGTPLNPHQEGKGKCSSNCFYWLVAVQSSLRGGTRCLRALWSFIRVLSLVKTGDITFSFG